MKWNGPYFKINQLLVSFAKRQWLCGGCVAVEVLFIVNEKRKEPDAVPVVAMMVFSSSKVVCCGFVVYLKSKEEGEMKIWGNFQYFSWVNEILKTKYS